VLKLRLTRSIDGAHVDSEHFDVLIVGAGISGISAAYHLKTRCPKKTYAVLEARPRLGGTWDLFRYPGIRSDSDMYTLGFSFRPWTDRKAIADGPSILAYLRDTAQRYGIDERIRFGHKAVHARWSSEAARWAVSVEETSTGKKTELTCGFLFMCSGYYDYGEGYTPELPGIRRFRGRIVHPQKWAPDVAYEGKRVVVIGSGATAVTLVPELAKKAASVTMLQRSPTYIVSLPQEDKVANWLREHVPATVASGITRWKNVALTMGFYQFCRRFPEQAKNLIVGGVQRAVGDKTDVAKHFTPTYEPWDQRLCVVPDGDLFDAVRTGKAAVVTDRIETFTETGIKLESGATLEADLIVTATGLKLKLFGGMGVEVDGHQVEQRKTIIYKGMMASDVPNLAMAVGYTNASWTLRCDLISQYVCRLLNYMDARGHAIACPRYAGRSNETAPLLGLMSGYITRSLADLPKQGTTNPWRVYQNYAIDLALLRYAPVADRSMVFSQAKRPRSGSLDGHGTTSTRPGPPAGVRSIPTT
jgi:cation diffusion facilitator CzcD-associated flavoprotein CzcO